MQPCSISTEGYQVSQRVGTGLKINVVPFAHGTLPAYGALPYGRASDTRSRIDQGIKLLSPVLIKILQDHVLLNGRVAITLRK